MKNGSTGTEAIRNAQANCKESIRNVIAALLKSMAQIEDIIVDDLDEWDNNTINGIVPEYKRKKRSPADKVKCIKVIGKTLGVMYIKTNHNIILDGHPIEYDIFIERNGKNVVCGQVGYQTGDGTGVERQAVYFPGMPSHNQSFALSVGKFDEKSAGWWMKLYRDHRCLLTSKLKAALKEHISSLPVAIQDYLEASCDSPLINDDLCKMFVSDVSQQPCINYVLKHLDIKQHETQKI